MSIGQGMDNAFNMFLAMQRNRAARDELEYRRQQDALARSDRLDRMRLDEAYRRDALAQGQGRLDQEAAQFAAGADQRAATLESTRLGNESQRIANEVSGLKLNSENNDIIRNNYYGLDLVDPTDPAKLNKERIAEGFKTGNKPIVDAVLLQISSQLNLPKGSKAIGIDRLPGGPGFVIRIQNEDGSVGVLTEDGTSNPDSRVQEFTPESLAKFAEWGYQTGVVPNSSLNMGEFRGMQGVINAGFQNEADVVTALPGQAQRAAVGVILSAETEEERAQVTDALAQDAGLTPRAQSLLKQRKAEEEKGKLGGNQERTTARIAEIDAELADLGFNSSGTRTEAAQMVASTENLTGPQINEAVESGALTVTPELQRETADMMRNAGVEEMRQLKRLNAKQQALARAVLMASTTDSTLRNNIAKSIDNIIETGSPSMSQKDVVDDNLDRERLGISSANLQISLNKYLDSLDATGVARVDDAVDALEELRTGTTDLFFSEDGKPQLSVDAARAFTTNILPELQARMRKIPRNADGTAKYPQEEAALMDAIHRGVSLSLASYADDFSNLADLFNFKQLGRGEAADAVTATDFIGNRIQLTYDKGAPDVFYFLDAEGNRTDRGVNASDIQKEDDFLYRYMIQAAQRTKGAR